MLRLFNRSTQRLLGIDISARSVRVVELSCSNDDYTLEAMGVAPVREGAIEENGIVDTLAVSEALTAAIALARTKLKHAAVQVSGAAVITKVIEMEASLGEDEMETQIAVEADQYIPYDMSEVAMDFEVLGLVPDNDHMVEVLVAACRNDSVDQRVEVLEQAGITAKVVDVEAYAIERACRLVKDQFHLPEDNPVLAVLDLGSTKSVLYVLHHDRVIYTREQMFGGQQLTDEIQRRYGLELDAAESAKQSGELPDDYEPEVLQPFIEAEAQQISRALQYFYSSSTFNDVDGLLLIGGSSNIAGLADVIEKRLGIVTRRATPFDHMKHSRKVDAHMVKQYGASLFVACGLAMRGFADG